MKKPEQLQWSALQRATSHQVLWQRHEDKLSPDIPDLSFVTTSGSGWVELKTLAHWPRKVVTPVNLPHLRPGQVNWAELRWTMGANCWMLLQVVETNEWLLLDPSTTRLILERKLGRNQLMTVARSYWEKVPNPMSLVESLTLRKDEKRDLLEIEI